MPEGTYTYTCMYIYIYLYRQAHIHARGRKKSLYHKLFLRPPHFLFSRIDAPGSSLLIACECSEAPFSFSGAFFFFKLPSECYLCIVVILTTISMAMRRGITHLDGRANGVRRFFFF